MTSFVDISGLDRLIARVNALGTLDATPLMGHFMKVIADDNRKGVLAGLDKDGNRMRSVTYRPKRTTLDIKSDAARDQRNRAKARARKGVFGGFGANFAGHNNNLTREQYEALDGPPLAPRRQFSRVITNLRTAFERSSDGKQWTAVGAWFEVVSATGYSFLPAHFAGKGRLPVRDIAGVRPEGREKARKAAIAWMADQVRTAVRSA